MIFILKLHVNVKLHLDLCIQILYVSKKGYIIIDCPFVLHSIFGIQPDDVFLPGRIGQDALLTDLRALYTVYYISYLPVFKFFRNIFEDICQNIPVG